MYEGNEKFNNIIMLWYSAGPILIDDMVSNEKSTKVQRE